MNRKKTYLNAGRPGEGSGRGALWGLAAVLAAVLGPVLFAPSCANTKTPPTGGKKDTIPPVIVGLRPLPGDVNVPTDTKIQITFDEYVTVKEPKGIYLSPPLSKAPRYRLKGKTVEVYFEEPLRDSTTYTLNLIGAIADNNEGNMYPGFTLYFSTGPSLDSMLVTGTVVDCNTLQPVKGATVMMYRDLADSALFLSTPDASVRTDDWGYFALRNVAAAPYRLYAILDEANNNKYDPDNDKVAFVDSVIIPSIVVNDTLPEVLKYDMKDSAHCMARNSQYELALFRERPSKQLIKEHKRTAPRSFYMSFMAPDAKIDSMWIRGIPHNRLITQFNIQRDSLEVWVNDRRRMPDTLHVFVDYLKTDSLGKLEPFTEHLRLYEEGGSKSGGRRSSRRDLKHDDTTCVVEIKAEADKVEQDGFVFNFKYPIIWEGFDSVTLKSVNPRQQEAMMNFKVRRDSLNLRRYTLTPTEKLLPGYEYILKVPWRQFRDINGYYNDSSQVKVSLPKDDKLASLTLNLSGVNAKYIVDLLNEKRDKVLRSYNISSDCSLAFPYLKAGKYSIRITEDKNANGLVETGSVLEHRQPEKVKFYTLKDGSYVLDIPESVELEQEIDIAKLFED